MHRILSKHEKLSIIKYIHENKVPIDGNRTVKIIKEFGYIWKICLKKL